MTPDGYDLSGRVALVTGGGTGIGAASAMLLARYGADVVIAGRTEATLDKTSREIAEATGRRCLAVQADVQDEAQVKALVARTVAEMGRIDILVNNAGWGHHGPLNGMTMDLYRGEFAINMDTTFLCSREAGAHFIAQGSGAIVNLSSVAGTKGVAGMAAYSASKAAIQMFTRVSAAEWGPLGVRVNCVAPGLIATENASKDFADSGLDVAAFCKHFPLQRAGTAEDVARAIVFLASDAAGYITGVTLAVDGGPT
jgi:NAD(P)-dependent dehydrogenase (short-subunit alcohol dehydrogenase family)